MSILPSLNEPATKGNVIKLILLLGGLGLLGWYGLTWMKKKPKRKKNPSAGIPVIDNEDEDSEEEIVEEEVDEEDGDEDEVDEDVEELSRYY